MTRQRQSSLLIIVLLFLGLNISADPLYDASLLEKEGNYEKAFSLYEQWLVNNPGHPRFSEILFRCASISEDADDSINLLAGFSVLLEENDLRDAYLQIAWLYELTFRYSDSADAYRTAALIGRSSPDPIIQLKYLKLLYQSGEIPKKSDIDVILMSDISPEIYVDALIFKAELCKYENDWTEAERILVQSRYSNLYPEIQYALWDIHNLTGNREEAHRILIFMENTYPDSVELALMDNRIKKIPRLSDFFLTNKRGEYEIPDEQELSYVQVGVFSSRENALSLSEELYIAGFDSILIEERSLTKVLVIDVREEEIVIDQLKRRGFEGFRIDYQPNPD